MKPYGLPFSLSPWQWRIHFALICILVSWVLASQHHEWGFPLLLKNVIETQIKTWDEDFVYSFAQIWGWFLCTYLHPLSSVRSWWSQWVGSSHSSLSLQKVMVWYFGSENSHEVMTALMVSCYFQIAVVKIDCACNNFIDMWKVCCDCIRLHCFAGWWTWLAFIKEGVLRLKIPVWTVFVTTVQWLHWQHYYVDLQQVPQLTIWNAIVVAIGTVSCDCSVGSSFHDHVPGPWDGLG
jgi:hypothetical protein